MSSEVVKDPEIPDHRKLGTGPATSRVRGRSSVDERGSVSLLLEDGLCVVVRDEAQKAEQGGACFAHRCSVTDDVAKHAEARRPWPFAHMKPEGFVFRHVQRCHQEAVVVLI